MQVSGAGRDGPVAGLIGRRDECVVIDQLVDAVTGGESRALLIRGESGIGKTALLDYAAARASELRVVRIVGIQSEMELAFAGIHQLCLPLLPGLENLPPPQRNALETALGTADGPSPDQFLVGLAVLNLLSDAAVERPLLCLVDDEQWLDRSSAHVLAFVARRLGSESVGMIFAARRPSDAAAGLPALVVRGLRGADARTLLESTLSAPLDPRVRDQIIAETGGNPLALLELPRGLRGDAMAEVFGLPGGSHVPTEIEHAFRLRVGELPEPTRVLLLVAAAEPTGDTPLVWRAAARLGIDSGAAAPAVEAELASFDTRVTFRHPLVRSAVYHSAALRERQRVHRALAAATDAVTDPDRRAWHLAHAAAGPDADVADELERSAARARSRGGVGAAAAFLERATALTVDPVRRGDLALGAAAAKVEAGAFEAALDLLTVVEDASVDQRARADVLRARLAFVTSHGSDAPPLLLKAARQLEDIDPARARAVYIEAMMAAMFAGRLATAGTLGEIAQAAGAAPPGVVSSGVTGLLLDWLTTHYSRGYVAARSALRDVLNIFDCDAADDVPVSHLLLASSAAHYAWDDVRLDAFTARHVQRARATGALSEVPIALNSRAIALLFFGDLDGVADAVDEIRAAHEATEAMLAPYAELGLAALRGDVTRTESLVDATVAEATARGEGNGLTVAWWAEALLHNGFGSSRKALEAASRAAAFPPELASANWALSELVEAASRSGAFDTAVDAAADLVRLTESSGTDWASGLGARARALVSGSTEAEGLYRESIERLETTRARPELARSHLLYGEWLRRERRRTAARTELRIAHDMFTDMGMSAFAARAQRELAASGDRVRERAGPVADRQLTAQEAHIARLAREGLSNPEIGSRLFISARTVQYHLSKVFTKLDISSRSQLDTVLGHVSSAE